MSVTIIIPTFNESENVEKLVAEIRNFLVNTEWKIFFVDDNSTDGTKEKIKNMAKLNNQVDGIIRIGERGLSGAVLAGLNFTNTEYVAVMDADLQHDPSLINEMLKILHEQKNLNLCIASRYKEGNNSNGLTKIRFLGSKAFTFAAKILSGRKVTDPMSGYFVIRTDFFKSISHTLSKNGYKILLDIVSTMENKNSIEEFHLNFRVRNAGESKMDSRVIWELIVLFLHRACKSKIPRYFISYSMIGLIGLVVHTASLYIFHIIINFQFDEAQILATCIAIVNNYLLNNYLTFQVKSLSGARFLFGYLKFSVICISGATISYLLALCTYNYSFNWLLSGLIGSFAAGYWNYTLNKYFTWSENFTRIEQLK